MTSSKVAIVRTSPRTILEDYHRLMNLADYQNIIDKTADTALKVNISWHFFYPGFVNDALATRRRHRRDEARRLRSRR